MALLMVLLLLPVWAMAQEKRVFRAGETEPFSEEDKLLILRVAPLMGGDSMLLTYGERSMMVDMGTKNHSKDILKMLADAGLESVEYAFSTHPHNDHLGSMVPLLEAGIRFDQFITAYPHDYQEDGCLQNYAIKAVKQAGIPVVDVDDGDIIEFDDVEIQVFRQNSIKKINESSAMLMIRYGVCKLLLTADVGGPGQPVLMEMHDLKADIMKYPHHGLSRMHKEFLQEVDPEFVFIPHGAVDTKDAQKQLRNAEIPVIFSTWGQIVMASNGEKWIVDQLVPDDMKEYVANYRLKD